MYVTAKECVGLPEMPSREHNVRNKLNKLAKDDQKRKRQGTKAFEYHIDCLPAETRMALMQQIAKEEADKSQSA
ncbi:DNA-binding protein, partial [Vibrio parahaemolyticus]|nr:DNA-binding protein [Vibrio parahaemolyticus]